MYWSEETVQIYPVIKNGELGRLSLIRQTIMADEIDQEVIETRYLAAVITKNCWLVVCGGLLFDINANVKCKHLTDASKFHPDLFEGEGWISLDKF